MTTTGGPTVSVTQGAGLASEPKGKRKGSAPAAPDGLAQEQELGPVGRERSRLAAG